MSLAAEFVLGLVLVLVIVPVLVLVLVLIVGLRVRARARVCLCACVRACTHVCARMYARVARSYHPSKGLVQMHQTRMMHLYLVCGRGVPYCVPRRQAVPRRRRVRSRKTRRPIRRALCGGSQGTARAVGRDRGQSRYAFRCRSWCSARLERCGRDVSPRAWDVVAYDHAHSGGAFPHRKGFQGTSADRSSSGVRTARLKGP